MLFWQMAAFRAFGCSGEEVLFSLEAILLPTADVHILDPRPLLHMASGDLPFKMITMLQPCPELAGAWRALGDTEPVGLLSREC